MSWNFADNFRDWGLKYFSAFHYRITKYDCDDDKATNVLTLWKLKNPAIKIKITIIAQV